MKRLGALAMTALLAGCATSSAPQRPPVTARAARPPIVRSIAVSPADYVATASSASLFVIRASQFLTQRSNSGLGSVARRFAADQEGVGSQLSFAGRRLDLLPQATLNPTHQAMLDALTRSGDPAATYRQQLGKVLAQMSAFHRQYERYGTSPTLRPVAAMAAPVFERELAQLRAYGRN